MQLPPVIQMHSHLLTSSRPVLLVSFTPLAALALLMAFSCFEIALVVDFTSNKRIHTFVRCLRDAFLSCGGISMKGSSAGKPKFGSTTEIFFLIARHGRHWRNEVWLHLLVTLAKNNLIRKRLVDSPLSKCSNLPEEHGKKPLYGL